MNQSEQIYPDSLISPALPVSADLAGDVDFPAIICNIEA
jgi:hypothetical protein